MRRLRVGLAGLGRMGRIHAANLAWRCPSARLAACTDADPVGGRRSAAELDVPVDRVVRRAAVRRGRRGDRHPDRRRTPSWSPGRGRGRQAGVLREADLAGPGRPRWPPWTRSGAPGCRSRSGFHRRFDPDWVAAAERIRAGELGEVTSSAPRCGTCARRDPAFLAGSGGFFVDVTMHDLDVARWMVGEVVEVTAHGAARPTRRSPSSATSTPRWSCCASRTARSA